MGITITVETPAPVRQTPHNLQVLLRLQTWLSPAFPVGGFAYSGGLERAAADRLVTDGRSLAVWIATLIERGGGHNDGLLLAEAHRIHADPAALFELNALALALAPTRERYDETRALGTAFVEAARCWPARVFTDLPPQPAYPVAVGAVAGAHGLDVELALAAFFNAFASQAVSAGIRLSLIGQRQGVEILAELEPLIAAAAGLAARSDLSALGSATILADVASHRHETQVTRLFRS